MLSEEAKWLGRRIESCRDDQLFPFLNVGSSTGEFRSVTQPHIDAEIFRPLRRRGGPICHLDMKDAPGVDIVGDVLDPAVVGQVRETVVPHCVLLSNLLEHVTDPANVARAVTDFVGPGGLIFVSGPRRYPYHPDPIDTRFRPTVDQLHSLFPGTRLVDADLVVSRGWRPWSHLSAGRFNAVLYLARIALPIYRPRAWRRRLDSLPFAFRRVSAYAVLLVKE